APASRAERRHRAFPRLVPLRFELASDLQRRRFGDQVDRRADRPAQLAAAPAVADPVRIRRRRLHRERHRPALTRAFEDHLDLPCFERTARVYSTAPPAAAWTAP